MNAHQVEAWYEGLKEQSDAGGASGIGARSVALLSGFLNLLLVYAFIQLAVALPGLEGQRPTAAQEKKREESSRRAGELKIESMDARKAKKDGKR